MGGGLCLTVEPDLAEVGQPARCLRPNPDTGIWALRGEVAQVAASVGTSSTRLLGVSRRWWQ